MFRQKPIAKWRDKMTRRLLLCGFACIAFTTGCAQSENSNSQELIAITNKGKCNDWSKSLETKIGNMNTILLRNSNPLQREGIFKERCESAIGTAYFSFTKRIKNSCASVAEEIESMIEANGVRESSKLSELSYNIKDIVTHVFKNMCYAEAGAAVAFDKNKHVFVSSNYAGIQNNPLEFKNMFTGELAASHKKILEVIEKAFVSDDKTKLEDVINVSQKEALIHQVIIPWYAKIYKDQDSGAFGTNQEGDITRTINAYYARHATNSVRSLLNMPDVLKKKN